MPVATMVKSRVVPARYSEVFRDDTLGIEVYADENGASLLAYAGKKTKADFHYKFPNPPSANAYLEKWLTTKKAAAAEKEALRRQRQHTANLLQVGDVLVSSWGYEQTNIDYYQVVALVGRKSVEIRAIGSRRECNGNMTGSAVPKLGDFQGEPTRHLVNDGQSVRVNSYQHATRKQCIEVAGVKIFKPDRWSTYA